MMREFNELRARQVIAEAFYRAFRPFDFRKVTFDMNFQKVPNENIHMLKVAIAATQ
tara:strand:- start:70 stop:237 length:168 start_codon:yes stop_codon:yes gene_type:complete